VTREQRIHCAATFLMDLTASAGFFSFPLLLYSMGASVGTVGLIGGLRYGVYTATCLSAGKLSRRFRLGPRIATIGALVWAAAHLLIPSVGTVAAVAACGVIGSLGLAVYWPALQAWTGAERDQRSVIGRLMAFNMTWGTALALSPYPSGRLFEWSQRAPFYVVAVGAVLAGGLVLFLGSGSREARPAAALREHSEATDDTSRFLAVGWLGNGLGYLLVSIHREIFPKQAAAIGLGPEALGGLLFARQATQVLAFYLASRWQGWRCRYAWMAVGHVLAAGSFAVLAFAQSLPAIAACYIANGLVAGLVYFASMYYSVSDPAHKERRAGFHEATVGIGCFAGPLISGQVAEAAGMRTALWCVPAVAAVAVIATQCLLLARRRRTA